MSNIFIHIPKNAGSAIKNDPVFRDKLNPMGDHLLPDEYKAKAKSAMAKAGEATAMAHARHKDMKQEYKYERSVAIIRNPWSRVVSRWTFYQTVVNQGRAPDSYTAKTFEEFLEERHKYGELPYYWHRAARGWYPQKDYISKDTNCLRYENLWQDSKNFFSASRGVQYRNVSNGKMKEDRTSVAGRKPYKDYYNDQTIQIVADWYKKDIEYFDFDFDTGARKNVWALKDM